MHLTDTSSGDALLSTQSINEIAVNNEESRQKRERDNEEKEKSNGMNGKKGNCKCK